VTNEPLAIGRQLPLSRLQQHKTSPDVSLTKYEQVVTIFTGGRTAGGEFIPAKVNVTTANRKLRSRLHRTSYKSEQISAELPQFCGKPIYDETV